MFLVIIPFGQLKIKKNYGTHNSGNISSTVLPVINFARVIKNTYHLLKFIITLQAFLENATPVDMSIMYTKIPARTYGVSKISHTIHKMLLIM